MRAMDASTLRQHRELVERALAQAGGTHRFEDIEQGVETGRYQFWPGVRSIIVTEVLHYPAQRVCHCFLAAGDLEEILAMRTWVEAWARGLGCEKATICGRAGWTRTLKDAGYEASAVYLEKKL